MSTHDYLQISRYVEGDMNPEETLAFEKMLEQDESLKKETEFYKELNDTLRMKLHPDEQELEFKHTLDGLRSEFFKPTAKLIPLRKKVLWIASAAATIIIILMIWSPWSQPDLYRQYASIEMGSAAVRGSLSDSLLAKATIDFNNKDFASSIPYFEELVRLDSSNSQLRFYYGIALMETNAIERARSEFGRLVNGSSLYRHDAAFYMALSYLKEGRLDLCREWLGKIPSQARVYAKARSLLSKLD